LPILSGDRLAGKLDATADRKAGLLRADAVHQDIPFGKTASAAVRKESGIWLAGGNWTSNCLHKRQPAPRTAYRQGVSGRPLSRTSPGREQRIRGSARTG